MSRHARSAMISPICVRRVSTGGLASNRAPFFRPDRKEQLEILSVAQGPLERRSLVTRLTCCFTNGHVGRSHDSTGPAFVQNVVKVGRQAVADVDHGVQFDRFVESDRLADSRLKREMLAGETSAEIARHQDPIARLAPPRRTMPRPVGSPMTVVLKTRGPSHELVSPPAIATSNWRASDSTPACRPSASSRP